MKKDFIDLAFQSGEQGRGDSQYYYHTLIGDMFSGVSILDVGAGLGHSRSRLAGKGNIVTLQDVAPGLNVDINKPVEEIEDNSYDVVTCFDVLEHITSDHNTFLAQLIRISRQAVVVTTPNYNVSKNANPYHVKEYTPFELFELINKHKYDSFWTMYGSGSGDENYICKDFYKKLDFLDHKHPHHGFILFKEKQI